MGILQLQEGSPRAAVEAVKAELGLERLESFPVVHCAHAFGLAMASRDGWSLALSGDTRPCDAVVAAAQKATVLIHEVRRAVLRVLPCQASKLFVEDVLFWCDATGS